MGKYVKKGNLMIGFEKIPSLRKKPCICIRRGNVGYVLGTFKNEEDAEFFVDKLAELTNAITLEVEE